MDFMVQLVEVLSVYEEPQALSAVIELYVWAEQSAAFSLSHQIADAVKANGAYGVNHLVQEIRHHRLATQQPATDADWDALRLRIRLLGEIGEIAVTSIPELLTVLGAAQRAGQEHIGSEVNDALTRIGRPAVSALIEPFQAAQKACQWDTMMQLTPAIGGLGTDGVQAVPALLAALDVTINTQPPQWIRVVDHIAAALRRIGSAPPGASPDLQRTIALVRAAGYHDVANQLTTVQYLLQGSP